MSKELIDEVLKSIGLEPIDEDREDEKLVKNE